MAKHNSLVNASLLYLNSAVVGNKHISKVDIWVEHFVQIEKEKQAAQSYTFQVQAFLQGHSEMSYS